ncbi:hypothetical protein [Clostridium gasigenes]|uniref:ABC-2 family transporter protein n=1 Tax=Clostridium gasigenes TaxID=94869 RepID=A0A7X0SHY4_9CLOT|nr:hypothetical protein [Clostridium gasigenes]MBB6716663.1 hypothetical protein [Clostridium gasigenes]
MKVIFNEIKKIFNWKMCVVLLMGTLLIYQMVTEFDIKVFPNGSGDTASYNITVKMVEDYGNEMDEEEFVDFQRIHEEKINEADKFLSNNEDFNKYEIYSYEDYIKQRGAKGDTPDEDFEKMYWDNLLSKDGDIFWELQSMNGDVDRYKSRDAYLELLSSDYSKSKFNGDAKARLAEISENKEYNSIFPRYVFDNYIRLIKGVAVSIIIGIAFMLTPLFIKDKRDKVEYIQYSSKIGRGLFKSKLIAGFISAMIIATVEIIIYSILYSTNNTSMFFKSNINSIFNYQFWFSMTFIQYIILTVACVYILSIITAFISMFVSRKVSSYVVGIGVQVPIVFILGQLTVRLLLNNLTFIYDPKYLTFGVYIFLIGIVVTIIYKASKKEEIRDIFI